MGTSAPSGLLKKAEEGQKKRSFDDFVRMDRYTVLVILFTEFALLLGTGNYCFMIFAGAVPQAVSCSNSTGIITDVCKEGFDYKQLENCELDVDYEFKSVNVDFGYLCKDSKFVKNSISIQMIGVFVGTLFAGYLSDRFGRLKLLMISYIATALLSGATVATNSLLTFTILRTLQGPFVGGIVGTTSVYLAEYIPKHHRYWVTSIFGWSFNFILIVILAVYSKEWRAYQLNIVAISSPAFVLFWFVYESPRWLIQHGHLDEARIVLEKIQKTRENQDLCENEIDLILDSEYEASKDKAAKVKQNTLLDLFHTKELGRALLILSMGTLITSTTNYSFVFKIDELKGSIYWNTLILAGLRWSINLFTGVADYKVKCIGRKHVHLIAHGIIGFSVGSIAAFYILGIQEVYPIALRVLTIVTLAVSTQVYLTKNIVMMEVFPTVIRNQAVSVRSVFSRMGAIFGPQLFQLSPWQAVPYFMLSFLAFADTALFQIFIPETKGIPLPEKLPEKKKKDESHGSTEDQILLAERVL